MSTRRRLVVPSLAVGALLLAFACDNGTDVPMPAGLEKVSGDAQSDTVARALPSMLVVRVNDDGGSPVAGVQVGWSVADGSVSATGATTGQDGQASAEWTLGTTAGEQSVTAEVANVPSVTFTATALPGRPTAVELGRDTVRIHALQDTADVTAAVTDSFGNALDASVLEWSSSDTAVADVDSAGRVWSRAVGEVEVSATTGGASATSVVIVDQVVAAVSVFPDSIAVSPDGLVQFIPSAADSNGFDVPGTTFTWSSSDTTVAVVSEGTGGDGYASTKNPGTTLITATSQGVSGSATLVVVDPGDPVELTVRPDSALLTAIGESASFDVLAVDSAGYRVPDPDVSWSSTDTAVVTVDSTGLATAAGDGTAYVVAEANGVTDSATVVVDQAMAAIAISPAEVVFTATGDAVQLTADATDANGYPVDSPELQWSSSSAAVSVDASGYIVGQQAGSSTITAEADGTSASVAVDVLTTVGVARTWIGGDPADSTGWMNARNWAPAGLVNGQDTASVPATASHMPHVRTDPEALRVVVEPGAVIELFGHTLTVHGDVVADGLIDTGRLVLDGTGSLSGSLPDVQVTGAITLTGEAAATGVDVDGGVIHFDGHALRIRP